MSCIIRIKKIEEERNGTRQCFLWVKLNRQFGAPFQRSNGRWTVMDSTCGLLINLGTAIGEPLSTCSKLNKAHPEMALFSLNSPSALLSHCRGLEQRKWENLDCEIMMDIYHTYCKGYIHHGGEISFPIMKKSTQGLWENTKSQCLI